MSTREKLRPNPVFNATTGQSMAGNLTSVVTVVPGISLISYDISWVGTAPVGTIAVQGSNTYTLDCEGNPGNAGNWTTIPFENSAGSIVTSIAVSGSPGNAMVALSEIPFWFIRIVYTRTSGTGTLSATIAGKVS